MAKKNLDDKPASETRGKYDKELKGILPEEFNVLDIVVRGKKVIVSMKEIMEITNTENKQEIISAMNRASTHFFYFGRVKVDLEAELQSEEEAFDMWLAQQKNEYVKEDSEKARERKVMAEHGTMYTAKKDRIAKVKVMLAYTEIAYKSLDKNIALIQSIGAMVRSGQERQGSNDAFNLPKDDDN